MKSLFMWSEQIEQLELDKPYIPAAEYLAT